MTLLKRISERSLFYPYDSYRYRLQPYRADRSVAMRSNSSGASSRHPTHRPHWQPGFFVDLLTRKMQIQGGLLYMMEDLLVLILLPKDHLHYNLQQVVVVLIMYTGWLIQIAQQLLVAIQQLLCMEQLFGVVRIH